MRIGIFLLLSFLLVSPCLAEFPSPAREISELRRSVVKGDEKALGYLADAAEAGSSWAQVWLGEFYSAGKVLPKDDEEAAKWYRKAAEKGNPQGLESLANAYGEGRGVELDINEARRLYIKAAQDDPVRQGDLGLRYSMGQDGFDVDKAEAVKWYRRCVEQGAFSVWILSDLADIYGFGRGNVPQNTLEAYFWAVKAKAMNGGALPDVYIERIEKVLAMPLTEEEKASISNRKLRGDTFDWNAHAVPKVYEAISPISNNTKSAQKVMQDRKEKGSTRR